MTKKPYDEFADQTDQDIEAANQMLEDSIRQLGRQRATQKTLADALGGYQDLLNDAEATVERYVQEQAATLRQWGKADGPLEWRSVGHFTESLWLIEDDGGAQRVLTRLKSLEYGADLEEYHTEVADKRAVIAKNRAELARRKMERASEEVDQVYADEMSRISGG